MLTNVLGSIRERVLYRGGTGHFAFIFHRLSGLAILSFLLIHVVETSTVSFTPSLYEFAMALYRSPFFMVGEIVLVAAIIFHSLNGFKVTFLDLRPHLWTKENERKATLLVYVGSVILWLPAAIFMGRHLFIHEEAVAVTDTMETTAVINLIVMVALAIAMFLLLNAGRMASMRSANVKRNTETWLYWFMRYSGAMLLPLLYGHVIIKDIVHGVAVINVDYVALYWGTISWRIYDAFLVAFTMAHGMNGLKQVLEDYIHSPSLMKRIRLILLVLWAVITIAGAYALVAGVAK